MRRLQSVQNVAARLITGTRRCLRQLHWLPVRQRVDFKIVTLVHRSLSGHIPSYLADDCRLVTMHKSLPLLDGLHSEGSLVPIHAGSIRLRSHWYEYKSGYLCTGSSKHKFACIPAVAVHIETSSVRVRVTCEFHSYEQFLVRACFYPTHTM